MRRPALLLLLGIVFLLGACGTEGGSQTKPRLTADSEAETKRGAKLDRFREDLAPEFTVTTFEGETFSLSEQRGTPVVLNFWESW